VTGRERSTRGKRIGSVYLRKRGEEVKNDRVIDQGGTLGGGERSGLSTKGGRQYKETSDEGSWGGKGLRRSRMNVGLHYKSPVGLKVNTKYRHA